MVFRPPANSQNLFYLAAGGDPGGPVVVGGRGEHHAQQETVVVEESSATVAPASGRFDLIAIPLIPVLASDLFYGDRDRPPNVGLHGP